MSSVVTVVAAAVTLGTAGAEPEAATLAPDVPPGMPAPGKVMLGLGGSAIDPPAFDQLTSTHHALHLVTASWNEARRGGWQSVLGWPLARARLGGYRIMVSIGAPFATDPAPRSPLAVAEGAADGYLLDLGRVVNESGQVVYVRPPAEMNGSWNTWCAFEADGTSRGAARSTDAYRRAFARIAAVVRGGDTESINARLANLGMPPLRTSEEQLPSSGKVALVWNPQGEGSPNVPGNEPEAYYPGRAWVDYVANDLYAQQGRAAWRQHDALYERYARHPFMIAEYAPWGSDDAAFVERMFRWVRTHPRTVAAIYFNGTTTARFRLSDKPATLRAYRRHAHDDVFVGSLGPELPRHVTPRPHA